MKCLQVKERQEVNGLELLVECRWTANFRAKGQVSAQELWNVYWLGGKSAQGTIVSRQWACAPLGFDEMPAAQIGICGGPYRRVL